MTTKKKDYVSMVREPLTVYWGIFNVDLDNMFNHSGFDYLQKMGYHIWDDVDYDAEDVEGQYDDLLVCYKKAWVGLTPEAKAQKLMDAGGLTADKLAELCIKKEYEYFQ